MKFEYTPEIWWLALAASLPFALALRLLSRPATRAERSLGWMLLAQAVWIAGQALELSVVGRTAKLYADGLQYFPMCLTGLLQMDFAHRFAGTRTYPRLVGIYVGIAGLLSAFFFLAPLHGLVRTDAEVSLGHPFSALTYSYTLGDGVLILLTLGAAVYSVATILGYLGRTDRAHRAGSMPIVVGLGLPVIVAIATSTADIRVLGQRDISFVMFGIGGLAMAWGLRSRRSVVTVPVARDRVFDVLFDPVVVLSDENVVLEINDAGAKALGLDEREVAVARGLATFSSSTIATAILALRGEEPKTVGPDAQGAFYELKQRTLPELTARIVMIRDVTERERARLLLVEDQQVLKRKFQAVFDQAFQLIGILDVDGRLVEGNQIALELAGVEPSDVLGLPFWDTPWWSHSAALQQQLRDGIAAAKGGELVRFDVTHYDAVGRLRQVDFSLKPIRSGTGEVVLLIAEGRDITDLRHTEEQLRQAQKMDALGRLAGGVAHDFNNLLTVMSGNLSLALETTSDPDLVELLGHVEQAMESAASLTSQLLAFGRKSLVQPKSLDVAEQLRRQVGMLRRIIPESIRISCEVEPDVGSIEFDPGQFQQVILNLAINAKHAMPSGGELMLSARRSRPDESEVASIHIEVVDTGEGIAREHLERIFEPFYTTKPQGQGTGLGLAMVYGAVSQHAGKVEVKSKPGRGTRFAIILPSAEEASAEFSSQHLRRASPTQGRTIYVVEDEVSLRGTIARVLEREGFHHVTFESGSLLLAKIDTLAPPDVLLTDAVMPDMSGYDLLEKIVTIWPSTAVLVMSGYSEDERLKLAISHGANFIPKPFTPRQLTEAMFLAMESKRPEVREGQG